MKVITIGRSTGNNNIVINDSKVSRSHLQIINDDNGDFYAIDLDSTNGTFVNGTRISGKVQLHKGDIVVIGNTTLSWEKYFNPKSDPKLGDDKEDKNTKSLNKRLCIIISSILICVLIGVIAIIVNNKKNEQDIEASYNEVTRAYTEEAIKAKEAKETAEKEAKDAQDAAEKAKENEKAAKIAQTEAEANEQKAKDAAELAKENEQQAKDAAELAKKNEQKAKEAEALAKENEQQAKDAAELAKQNEQKAKEAETLAKENEQKAKNELESTKKSLELTKEFYELLPEITGVHGYRMKNVCDKLGLNPKTEEKLKFVFDKRDNEGKEKIIKIIKEEIGSNRSESSQTSGSQVTPQGNTTSTSEVPSGTANGNTTTTETNASL